MRSRLFTELSESSDKLPILPVLYPVHRNLSLEPQGDKKSLPRPHNFLCGLHQLLATFRIIRRVSLRTSKDLKELLTDS